MNYGFFDWDDSEDDLWSHESPSSTVLCPNCGCHVRRSVMVQHECMPAQVEGQHLAKFDSEWKRTYIARSPRKPEADADESLWIWEGLTRWLATPAGRFAEYDAQRGRMDA